MTEQHGHHRAWRGMDLDPTDSPSPAVQSGQPVVGGSPQAEVELLAGTRDGFRSPAVQLCGSDGAPSGLVWASSRRGHG